MSLFKGSGVAIITPFNDDLSINYNKYIELVHFHMENNTDAIIVSGTTGEAPTISDEEKFKLFEITVKEVAGTIPVIAGTGSNDTKHAILLSKKAEEIGVDGLLLVTPYYNKSTQEGLVSHFTAIANEVNIPCILYNVPSRTGVNILPSTVLKLSKHKNITAVKEASGDISQIVKIASLIPDDFYLYSGNDDHVVPLLSLGGHGVISVVANILPKETHDMVMAFLNGDVKEAARLQLLSKSLIDSLFMEVNPIPVKTALNLMGMNVGSFRLPLINMSEAGKVVLEKEMKNLGLI
ncbi:MAG: 4-hydroxy-tetrahydrodipicolinate synthase [Clostridiales bacterium]|nr:4-hydroxy-tetrahydrodipicolinate synthase [Clostridiales bacterium]